jgi:DNA repair photolyase
MVKLIPKKGSTLHDFPYSSPQRKCPHFWIINVTPPGPAHCIHHCLYCYARDAIYTRFSPEMIVYSNLPQLVEKDIKRIYLCPPISISNVSDPCQDVPEVREAVKKLISLIMSYRIPFFVTTKGDPRFLFQLPGFIDYKPKFMAITIEGTPDILSLLSPGAPPFPKRLEAVAAISCLGINTIVRLDPLFVHLFYAVYGDEWLRQVEEIIHKFSLAGAKHVVASTGRLSRKRLPGGGKSSWQRIMGTVSTFSNAAARRMESEYTFDARWGHGGLLLRRDLRLQTHARLKEIVESYGMTYAVCQELGQEADSEGINNCQRFWLPFSLKQADGTFKPVPGCAADCYSLCRDKKYPPCGQPLLTQPQPFKISYLRKPALL